MEARDEDSFLLQCVVRWTLFGLHPPPSPLSLSQMTANHASARAQQAEAMIQGRTLQARDYKVRARAAEASTKALQQQRDESRTLLREARLLLATSQKRTATLKSRHDQERSRANHAEARAATNAAAVEQLRDSLQLDQGAKYPQGRLEKDWR